MVIKLNETWYPYCQIDAAKVQQLGHLRQKAYAPLLFLGWV